MLDALSHEYVYQNTIIIMEGTILVPQYHIVGKFGGELNLVVWWYAFKSPNYFSHACTYADTVPYCQISPPVVKTSFWAKLPNLMTANISNYTPFMLTTALF